jgi:GNAT superfamily N-acetyltransferase
VDKTFTIRRATPDDVLIITEQRRLMFIDMGFTDPIDLDKMSEAFHSWVYERLARGEYHAWFMLNAEQVAVSGAGLWLRDFPPNPGDLCGKRGYLLNVYTYPDYRRRGFAGQLARCAVEWCRDHGIKAAFLHATDAGRPVYEALGFKAHNEMFMWVKDLR